MISGKFKFFVLLLLGLILNITGWSQVSNDVKKDETLEKGLQILRKYFIDGKYWHVVNSSVGKDVQGLIHFVEDDPVDSVISNLNNRIEFQENLVVRLPENVSDSLSVSGFFPNPLLVQELETIGVYLQNLYQNKKISVPPLLTANLEERLDLISEGNGMLLFTNSTYTIPDSLQIPEVIPDSMLNSAENFRALQLKDSMRNIYIEQSRIGYNDSIISSYMDSVIASIRTKQFVEDYEFRKKRLIDSVKINNYQILSSYNDSVVNAVNDSIYSVLNTLVEYADYIDTTQVSIINFSGESQTIPLLNDTEIFTRVWLKNEQNDSLSILVKNTDKRSMQMLIDDGVTFTRFKAQETKQFDFKLLEKEISDFSKVGKIYELETPWRIGGEGAIGFTQTYLQNWKKGGRSAISSLMVLKGFADYQRADGKVKWENNGEFRNGWIRPGGEGAEIQKNDDKFELTSRFGVSAFKKWYYSSELNFETQLFKGFRYHTETNPYPITAFLAPGKTFFKIGLEYKPNPNFSLLLSPVTIKNVYVRDTLLIDQTQFGISKNKKSFWEPGLNADVKFKKKITEDITYETKYKMFINYQDPFRKFDINWENLFVMKLNEYINMRLMLHFIYDDDVLFPVFDENDVKIGDEPKLQIKEFLSIGFAYKINKKVMKTKRIR